MKKSLLVLSLLLFICSFLNLSAQNKIEVPLRFDHYYPYDEVNQALVALNKAYPQLTRLELVGHSDEGREIWSMTINNPATGSEQDKPGVYVDGNIHGNEVQATEVCLYFLNYLLTEYGKLDRVTQTVDRSVVYCIPTVNVDGRFHWFADANNASSGRSIRVPKDDDRDGLIDEDSAEDLDGDGFITQMRIRDTLGDYKTDPKDVRLMVRVEKGEKGEFRMLGTEGIDNDNDGNVNEDEPGYIDPNRNFPYNWQPGYVQGGAGSYPLEGKGLKAVSDYLYTKKNILVAWAFHNSGGMILRGPTSKSAQEYDRRDIEVFDYLGKNSEKMIPGYNYLISWKDLYTTWGDFGDFTDDIVGAFTLVGELFQSNTESYRSDTTKPATADERSTERIKFNDYLTNGAMYSNWKPFKHPLYGNIEIGGWSKFNSRLPQPFMLMDLVHRNAMAVFSTAFNLPKISMEVFEKVKISDDLYRIKVRLSNSKAVSSLTYQSVRIRINPMDYLKLEGKNVQVVAGGSVTDLYRNEASYKQYKPEIQFFQIPSFGQVEFQFLVSGKGKLKLEYHSEKATDRIKEIEL
ncbi:MAG: M14 family metallopeptidase [Bacteroidales bacterium]|jgi:hypothetical protein